MRNLSRFLILVSCLVLCLSLLSACRSKADAPELWSVLQLADAMLDSQPDAETLYAILPGDGLFAPYLRDSYQLGDVQPADGVLLVSGGVSAQELAVLRFGTEAEAAAAQTALEDYIARREVEYAGYFPEEAEMLGASLAFRSGCTAALAICPQPDEARRAFLGCAEREPPAEAPVFPPYAPEPSPTPAPTPVQAEAEWHYDEQRLLNALQSGSSDGLAEKDAAILRAVRSVIGLCIFEDMSDCEKALAIHDWIIYNAEYDANTLSQLPDFREDPDSGNPYGLLINRKGICLGYTSAFQLLMDVLGVECISVDGEAGGRSGDWEAHAWNMIRLDGDWYVVDCTWDDPLVSVEIGREQHHRYFNVTSDFIRAHRHRWDETAVPEATAVKYAWQG